MARTHISVINEPAYYEALGRFVHEFAATETALFLSLGQHAKIRLGIAKAIFPLVRRRSSNFDDQTDL
jgi:hypothetical protein